MMKNSKQNETLNHSMHHAYKSNVIKDFFKKIPFIFNLLKSLYIILLHLISKNRWKKLIQQHEIKLNLGSGPTNGTNGWVNVDFTMAAYTFEGWTADISFNTDIDGDGQMDFFLQDKTFNQSRGRIHRVHY